MINIMSIGPGSAKSPKLSVRETKIAKNSLYSCVNLKVATELIGSMSYVTWFVSKPSIILSKIR